MCLRQGFGGVRPAAATLTATTAHPQQPGGRAGIRPSRLPRACSPSAACLLLRLLLCFDGVDSAFYCWLNGQFLGYSQDSRLPAEFDATAAVQPRGNVLAVQASRAPALLLLRPSRPPRGVAASLCTDELDCTLRALLRVPPRTCFLA